MTRISPRHHTLSTTHSPPHTLHHTLQGPLILFWCLDPDYPEMRAFGPQYSHLNALDLLGSLDVDGFMTNSKRAGEYLTRVSGTPHTFVALAADLAAMSSVVAEAGAGAGGGAGAGAGGEGHGRYQGLNDSEMAEAQWLDQQVEQRLRWRLDPGRQVGGRFVTRRFQGRQLVGRLLAW